MREARERRGWKQGELAQRVHLDRTTLNKIERGTRGDVTISQLFTFAIVLSMHPVHLLTPSADDLDIEMAPGGPVMSPADARRWIRGAKPEKFDDWLDWFLDLPRDEQREQLVELAARRHGVHDTLTLSLAAEEIERDVSRWLAALERKEQQDA